MCLHELSNHVVKCARFIRFWHDMHRQDLRQNWLRSAKLNPECNFNWAHSPCKSLCWCLYLGRKCVSFQLKYRHHPTPIAPTWTCLLRNSRGNRQFFRTFFLGGSPVIAPVLPAWHTMWLWELISKSELYIVGGLALIWKYVVVI